MSLRLLNSVCKVLADEYPDIPVKISNISQNSIEPYFFVTLNTSGNLVKNRHVYQNNSNFQIDYYGEKNEEGQVLVETLYLKQEELTALFLLRLAVPVIAAEGVTEKQRYAKVESFTSDIRHDMGAVYSKLVLNFTDDIPQKEDYNLVETVEIDAQASTK